MKKVLLLAAAALLALGTATPSSAQSRLGIFDLGIYGGGAVSTDWFEVRTGLGGDEGDEEGYGPGLAPIFGATVGFFATPRFGLRLHFAYMPSRLFRTDQFFQTGPDDDDIFFDEDDGWPLNNYFYDLDLVFRPFADPTGIASFLGASYLFIGAGGLTSDVAASRAGFIGDDEGFADNTVGQGTVGLGFNLIPITRNVGIFAELAAHGYDSPVHIRDDGIIDGDFGVEVEDKFAVTTRLVAGLKFSFGGRDEPVAFAPAPLPPPPPPAPAPMPEMRSVRVCVVEGGQLREVDAMVDPATADTTVDGRRFSDVYPSTIGYAGGQDFFIRNEPITVNRTRYVKFGLTRIVPASALAPAGTYQGVTVFRDASGTGTPEVLYVPVRSGCEFQTYQREQAVRGVRG